MTKFKFNLIAQLYATEVELEAENEKDLDDKLDQMILQAESVLREHWKSNEGLSMVELMDFQTDDVENLDEQDAEEEDEDDDFDFDLDFEDDDDADKTDGANNV